LGKCDSFIFKTSLVENKSNFMVSFKPLINKKLFMKKIIDLSVIIWEGHKTGREREYCHLEKLHNPRSVTSVWIHSMLLSYKNPRCLGCGTRELRSYKIEREKCAIFNPPSMRWFRCLMRLHSCVDPGLFPICH
jgi:hypothetical protein